MLWFNIILNNDKCFLFFLIFSPNMHDLYLVISSFYEKLIKTVNCNPLLFRINAELSVMRAKTRGHYS